MQRLRLDLEMMRMIFVLLRYLICCHFHPHFPSTYQAGIALLLQLSNCYPDTDLINFHDRILNFSKIRSHLSKGTGDCKQNGTHEKKSFSGSVFHGLSCGVIRFVTNVSSKFVIGSARSGSHIPGSGH